MNNLNLNVHLISDFIAWKLLSKGSDISVLKLQKLLYYVQAWSLALKNESIFDDDFEAWAHGPVCKSLFVKYKHRLGKTMYDEIEEENLGSKAEFDTSITIDIEHHIDNVLEIYGQFTGTQLEDITHNEKPWMDARGKLGPYEKSAEIISKESMSEFYKSLLTAS